MEAFSRLGRFVSNPLMVGLLSLSFAATAAADCVCQCVNGELAAICTGKVNAQPSCAPRSCPATTADPSKGSQAVSLGGGSGSGCVPRQVLDTVSGKYEWQVLCR